MNKSIADKIIEADNYSRRSSYDYYSKEITPVYEYSEAELKAIVEKELSSAWSRMVANYH